MSSTPGSDGVSAQDRHVGDLVSAHLDGELDAETERRVAGHLEQCSACRQMADDAAAARSWIRSLPPVDSSTVVEQVLTRRRNAVRAGAAFVGLAAVVVSSIALTAAVIRVDVVPDVDALVGAHQAATRDLRIGDAGAEFPADPELEDAPASVLDLDGMAGARRVRTVGNPYSAPGSVEDGARQLDRHVIYDGEDLTMAVYTNGSVMVSVFQQPGRLDWDALPPGRRVTDGRAAWTPEPSTDPAESPQTTVMVSQIGHLVVTVVSEDLGAAAAVVDGLPDSRRDGTWERLHDACSRFADTFAFGG